VEGGHGGALVVSREDKAEDKTCPKKRQKIKLEKIRKNKEKMKEKESEKEGHYGHFTLLSTLHS
jgi:hypothetical protein